MAVSSRWLLMVCLCLISLSGCKSTAKHENPVFGAAPRRTSFDDAPNAKAIVEAEDLVGDTEDPVQLASAEEDQEEDRLFMSTVVATANGSPIFAGEVLERYGDYLRQVRPKLSSEDYLKLRDEIIRRDLKSHIQKHLLVERTKGELKPDQVKALNAQLEKMFEKRVEDLKKELKVTTRVELERELNNRATSLNDVRNTFITQGIAQGYLEARAKKPKEVTRQDLIDYYREHEDDYFIPAKVRWRQIQVTYANNGGKEKALDKLSQARDELDRGVPFEKVAAKYSDGPTAKEGGVRDLMQQGSLADDKLDELLFAMPVEASFAEHTTSSAGQIVQVLERTEEGVTPFTEVQDEIHEKLLRSSPSNVKDLIDNLYSEAVIETKYDFHGKDES